MPFCPRCELVDGRFIQNRDNTPLERPEHRRMSSVQGQLRGRDRLPLRIRSPPLKSGPSARPLAAFSRSDGPGAPPTGTRWRGEGDDLRLQDLSELFEAGQTSCRRARLPPGLSKAVRRASLRLGVPVSPSPGAGSRRCSSRPTAGRQKLVEERPIDPDPQLTVPASGRLVLIDLGILRLEGFVRLIGDRDADHAVGVAFARAAHGGELVWALDPDHAFRRPSRAPRGWFPRGPMPHPPARARRGAWRRSPRRRGR